MKKNAKTTIMSTNGQKTANTDAKPKTSARVRLSSTTGSDRTLIFTKKVSPKNGAIRVSATISKKGSKPTKVGRETFVSHEDANKAMDKMVEQAEGRGWELKVRAGASYVAKDKDIEIPEAEEVVEVPVEDESVVDETVKA